MSLGAGSHCYYTTNTYDATAGVGRAIYNVPELGYPSGRPEVSSMPFVVSVSCLPVYSGAKHQALEANNPTKRVQRMDWDSTKSARTSAGLC